MFDRSSFAKNIFNGLWFTWTRVSSRPYQLKDEHVANQLIFKIKSFKNSLF